MHSFANGLNTTEFVPFTTVNLTLCKSYLNSKKKKRSNVKAPPPRPLLDVGTGRACSFWRSHHADAPETSIPWKLPFTLFCSRLSGSMRESRQVQAFLFPGRFSTLGADPHTHTQDTLGTVSLQAGGTSAPSRLGVRSVLPPSVFFCPHQQFCGLGEGRPGPGEC